jgi:rubrerythrin
MEIRGSKTEKNLREAFAGESQARNRYSFFASQAKKEGYGQIAKIFEDTANNEKEHAKIWYKFLNGGTVFQTLENLLAAARDEEYEAFEMYPRFAKEAEEDGFKEIAFLFRAVAEIENGHKSRYERLAENIQSGTVFSRDEKTVWECSNCGYLVESNGAPDMCPVCKHAKAFFEIRAENF